MLGVPDPLGERVDLLEDGRLAVKLLGQPQLALVMVLAQTLSIAAGHLDSSVHYFFTPFKSLLLDLMSGRKYSKPSQNAGSANMPTSIITTTLN